jgi:hypothetical protein
MFNSVMITCGMFVLRTYTCIQVFFVSMYSTYIKDSMIANITHAVVYDVRKLLYDHRIEPPYPYFSISCREDRFKEIVIRLTNTQLELSDQFDDLMEALSRSNIFSCEKTFLLTMKMGGKMISRIHGADRQDYSISEEKARTHFLSIEYRHPEMESTVVIELDPALYLVGNEILSSGFIERYLEYQNETFVFDTRYVLDIMDSKIKMLTLTSDQYVVLDKTEYRVIRV